MVPQPQLPLRSLSRSNRTSGVLDAVQSLLVSEEQNRQHYFLLHDANVLRSAAWVNKYSILTRSPRFRTLLAIFACFTYRTNSSFVIMPLSFNSWTIAPT